MRELKFRAWDGKRMVYFGLGDLDDNFIIGDGMRVAPPAVVMQFTGLRDKNGKEIYEGDIVSEADGPGGAAEGTVENINGDTVVKYLPGTIPDDWNYEYYPVFGKMDHAEIIGNVYENPDLIA